MAVAEPEVRTPPTPQECGHPAPVTGIMAHEFSPYRGAQGPEGTRRTTMHYGPIVGALPIEAWHCEQCGLLRLSYPDGRREERSLYPGPQPGLVAVAAVVDPANAVEGRQARVSGLSAEAAFFEALESPAEAPLLRRISARLPAIGAVGWLSVLGLVVVAGGLLVAGYLAVYDYQTAAGEAGLLWALLGVFGGVVVLQIGAAFHRYLFPPGALPPSVAVALREPPVVTGATRAAVWLLGLAAAGLLLAGYLAVYDYQTSGAEGPVMVVTLACGLAAVAILIGDGLRRHLRRS